MIMSLGRRTAMLMRPEMRFREQFLYGHREILLDYCGFGYDRVLLGRIQHGHDLLQLEGAARRISPWRRSEYQWVWAHEAEIRAQENGVRNVRAIGSPWLYLLSLRDRFKDGHFIQSSQPLPGPGIFMPTHHDQFAQSSTHQAMAMQLRESDEWGIETVLLHGFDFLNRETFRAYESLGYRVASAGWPRDFPWPIPPWANLGNRVSFLSTLLDLMSLHSFVATDGFGTHVLYAASLGMPVLLVHPGFHSYEGASTNLKTLESQAQTRFQAELAIALGDDAEKRPLWVEAQTLQSLRDRLLGTSSFCSSEDLIAKLAWRSSVIPGDLSYNLT
jgi:hypothetical protein